MQRADFPEVIRLLDRYYGHVDYSLTSLFTDEQRRIVQLILNSTLSDIENSLTTIYEDHASLLHYLSQAGLPKPPALTLAAGFAINAGLRRALEADPIDQAQLRSFLSLAKADQVPLETATLSYIADQRMKRAMVELQMSSGSLEIAGRALALAPHAGRAALRAEPLAGAEHLVRDSAHLQLCAHRAGSRRPPALGEELQRTGRLPVDRLRRHQRSGSGGGDYGGLGTVLSTFQVEQARRPASLIWS